MHVFDMNLSLPSVYPLSNPSPADVRLFPELSSVGDTEEESAVGFCCVSDSGRGSGAVAGHPGRSALCPLQTGRADIQKQGTNAFHPLQSPPPPPPSLEMSLLYLIALYLPPPTPFFCSFLLLTLPFFFFFSLPSKP